MKRWMIIDEGKAQELGVIVNSEGIMCVDMNIAISYLENHGYTCKDIPQFLIDNKIVKTRIIKSKKI